MKLLYACFVFAGIEMLTMRLRNLKKRKDGEMSSTDVLPTVELGCVPSLHFMNVLV
jgi:hypothetical protein